MIKISVPARLHITLIDLGRSGYRNNGGIGFSINGFDSFLEFVPANDIDFEVLKNCGFTCNEILNLEEKIKKIGSEHRCRGLRLTTAVLPPRHCGFGSGTSVALAMVEAFKIANDLQLDRGEVVRYSGRGGTSGIGINGYFEGGFIFDAGRKFNDVLPTSSDAIQKPTYLPTLIARCSMPEWSIGILIPPTIQTISLEEETDLFKRIIPISESEVAKTAYHSIFGAYIGVMENDFHSFCRAINAIQDCRWKRSEISLYGTEIVKAMNSLRQIGADAVGMSSVGPALYFFSQGFDEVFFRATQIFPSHSLMRVSMNNSGRIIQYA